MRYYQRLCAVGIFVGTLINNILASIERISYYGMLVVGHHYNYIYYFYMLFINIAYCFGSLAMLHDSVAYWTVGKLKISDISISLRTLNKALKYYVLMCICLHDV